MSSVEAAVLTIYPRHRAGCPAREAPNISVPIEDDLRLRKSAGAACRCPLWVDGPIRKSLRTQSWKKAVKDIRDWSLGRQTDRAGKIPIKEATDAYIADAESRKLQRTTVKKYRRLFVRLKAFADDQGIRFLQEIDVATLRKFRDGWKLGDKTALKELERLRSFFRFCRDNSWTSDNPAKKLGSPRVADRPTLPFTRDELAKIDAAARATIAKASLIARKNAALLRVLTLVLRYSGLRIGDAVGLSTDRLADGKLRLYTQKTGTHVHCPLPDFVVSDLATVGKRGTRHWFWSGNGKLETATKDWQGRLKDLCDDAGIHGHAHRFRDTFAVELLLAGVPIERVSILMGHSSVRITEKHYAPWVRERQEQAEADVRRAWARDSMAAFASASEQPAPEGTNRVREPEGRPN